jgi:type I restriction enzyme M protein
MAIVLPQGNLNNVRAEFLRGWLRDQARLLAVVGLSENTFKKFTNTKTSVLLLQKWTNVDAVLDGYDVFMAINRRPVKDSSGRYNYRRALDGTFEVDSQGNRIVDHDLDEIADAFIEFAAEQKLGMWS